MRLRILAGAFLTASLMASCGGRPWTLMVELDGASMPPSPMILRVHDGDRSREWLIPLLANDEPDYLFLHAETRPSGPLELLEPGSCQVVATASPPRTGPGVRVT